MKRMLGPLLKLLLLLTRLENLTKSLSGTYSFEEFDKNGTTTQKGNIELIIQAPVSPPELSQLCQPHGEIWAWCSSTGEAPQYNWTLNDQPLDGGVVFLSNEPQTVILKRDIPGSITCTVSNHVSKESTTQELLTCPVKGGLSPITSAVTESNMPSSTVVQHSGLQAELACVLVAVCRLRLYECWLMAV
ncbi:hypothetical protein COCON_G00041230 [Conger conger]|uniref:Ig-like domain-containing protein n=1 Tax=Conger conger TaxID=82655 RepID=A0A9Q1DU17_CONCO|nr:hypothetical protein COCON_G00041230 [Conger conger]